jgi:hypothetical protein
MKKVSAILVLCFIPVFSISQSTNKARLKSGLLIDVMKELDIESGIVEVYEKIADDLQRYLGEEIRPGNLRAMPVDIYSVTDYDKDGNPSKGGLTDRKILDIISSNNSRRVIVEEDRVYVQTPDKVTIRDIEGAVLSENFLDFDDWKTIIDAANEQTGRLLNWRQGYTIAGTPEIFTGDGSYLVMYFGEVSGWVIFMPDNEARKLEL